MSEEYPERVIPSTLIRLGIMGIAVIIYATLLGLGLREDSFSSITVAASFSSGAGLGHWASDGSSRHLTDFLPLIPLILAGSNTIYKEIPPALKYLNAGLLGSLIIITGFSIRKLAGSNGITLLSAGLILGSRTLIELISWAHSELFYLVLGFIGLVPIGIYLQHHSQRGFLIGSIIAISLALLTPFAGISTIVGSIIVVALIWNADLNMHIKAAKAFGVVTISPTTFFVARNSIVYEATFDLSPPTWHTPEPKLWFIRSKIILG